MVYAFLCNQIQGLSPRSIPIAPVKAIQVVISRPGEHRYSAVSGLRFLVKVVATDSHFMLHIPCMGYNQSLVSSCWGIEYMAQHG